MQGLTEFLPVSSSGHLVLLQHLFGIAEPQVLFDVMLHIGTLAAILSVFRRDIVELVRATLRIAVNRKLGADPYERLAVAIVVGCIPTGVVGALFAEQFERLFASVVAAGAGLMITGALLMSTTLKTRPAREPSRDLISLAQALVVGTAQGIAIAPGVSRSGSTIAAGLLVGLARESAARFSFLLAIPATVGAFLFELRNHSSAPPATASVGVGVMLAGALVAAVTGVAALKLLLNVVRRGRISSFAYYCWAVGIIAIVLGLLEG